MQDWNVALKRLRGVYADATIEGYRSDFALFVGWCLDVSVSGGECARRHVGRRARGKADQEEPGRIVAGSPATVRVVCDWIEAAGLESGRLICTVYRGCVVRRRLRGFRSLESSSASPLPPDSMRMWSPTSLGIRCA